LAWQAFVDGANDAANHAPHEAIGSVPDKVDLATSTVLDSDSIGN
jgi:hypothetical protein